MKTCYVHIGMQKTGSTSIQNTLCKSISDNNFIYFPFKSANHGLIIYSMFDSRAIRHRAHIRSGKDIDALNKYNESNRKIIISTIDKNDAENFIMSGEMITRISRDGLVKLRDFLHIYFDHIYIVSYVRSPHSLMESAFQQLCKRPAGKFDIQRSYIGYKKIFSKFDDIFGEENVLLWEFNKDKLYQGDVVLDFANHLGLNKKSLKVEYANEGISRNALTLLYIYRKFGPGYGEGVSSVKENDDLIQKLSEIPGRKLEFSPNLVKPILDINRQDIQWIEHRLGVSFDESWRKSNSDSLSHEDELCEVDECIVNILIEMIKPSLIPKEIKADNPADIAMLVHTLRLQLAGRI